jgi:hypothetical protein
MEAKELLRKRIKQIADFPRCEEYVGCIFTQMDESVNGTPYWTYVGAPHGGRSLGTWGRSFELFPNIYKELQWWEDRLTSELPQYLKEEEDGYTWVYKADEDFTYKYISIKAIILKLKDDKRLIHLMYLKPATQEEYEQYHNQHTKQDEK